MTLFQAHDSVKTRLLSHLPGLASNENTVVPLVLIDTTDCDMYELVTEDEQSKECACPMFSLISSEASLVVGRDGKI